MIDIHCHILFGVDDGPTEIKESIALLEQAKSYGIDTIILTPHYRHGMFPYKKHDVEINYYALSEIAERLGIKLLLGCEYHVNHLMVDNFDNRRTRTMANSNYILTEYKNDSDYSYILTQTTEAIASGYIPIIAHIERYSAMTKFPERANDLRKLGALIQINADSVVGNDGWAAKHYCHRLIKKGWVDFVASDTHGLKNRPNHLLDAYKYVENKYGTDTAQKLFRDNAIDMFKAHAQNFQASALNMFHLDDKNYDAENIALHDDFNETITVNSAIQRSIQKKKQPAAIIPPPEIEITAVSDFAPTESTSEENNIDEIELSIEIVPQKKNDEILLPEDIDLPPVKKEKKMRIVFPEFEDDIRVPKKKKRGM